MRRWGIALAILFALLPSYAQAAGRATTTVLEISRTSPTGAASFRLDVTSQTAGPTGFVADFAVGLDRHGRPTQVVPGELQAFNENTEPTVFAQGHKMSTCDAGICGTGSTPAAGLTVIADDSGPTPTPFVFVIARGTHVTWEFTTHGYTLRRTSLKFSYLTGSDSSGTGLDYLGNGAEATTGSFKVPGGRMGSIGVGQAPCSTSGSGAASRGVGRIQLMGGNQTPTTTCPTDRGVVSDVAAKATSWFLNGFVAGESTMRSVRLLVVDLPLRRA